MSRQEDIEKLIKNHNRRLQKLKEKAALQGQSVDPSILIEMEDIELEIKNLEEEQGIVESYPLVHNTVISNDLARQIHAWFKVMGHQFENHNHQTADYFEWIINIQTRPRRGYDRILTHGIEREVEMHDIKVLREAVDAHHADEGWIVASRQISQTARDEVDKRENNDLYVYTFDELLDEHADFGGYSDWLEKEIKKQGVNQLYVPVACMKEEFDRNTGNRVAIAHYDNRNGWIDGYIDRWLDDPSTRHLSILGEFGTGKTWFILHYAWVALNRYRDAKRRGVVRPRLPLVIPLHDYTKAASVESLFSDFFFRKHEIPLPGYSVFEYLNRTGKFLLLFDGFDEMADRIDRQKMINNFWELAQVIVPGAKAILTCRTEHFPKARDGRDLLNAKLKATTRNLTGIAPQFEMLELEKFNEDQIRQALSLRTTEDIVKKVMVNYRLVDLVRRPGMMELVLDALPEIESGKPIDLARIYLYAVQRKMERDIKSERTFTSLADKLYFLCEVSWEILATNKISLNYRQFPDVLHRLFGSIVKEQKDLDHWQFDMMGQAMLIRNSDGDYTPAHRSLLEFFVAYKFTAKLGILASDFIQMAREQKPLVESPTSQDYTWSDYFHREIDENGVIKPIQPLREFIPEEISNLMSAHETKPLTGVMPELILNMISSDHKKIKRRLWAIIEETRGKTTAGVGIIGGIAATLLVQLGESFAGRDLSNTVLNQAQFIGISLQNSNFQGAELTGAIFDVCDLRGANFQNVNLLDASFQDVHEINGLGFDALGEHLLVVRSDNIEIDKINFDTEDILSSKKVVDILGIREAQVPYDWEEGIGIISERKVKLLYLNESWKNVVDLEKESHRVVYCMARSTDGCQISAGCIDGSILFWEKRDSEWKYLKEIKPVHHSKIRHLEWSEKGQYLASSDENGVICIWDTQNNLCLHRILTPEKTRVRNFCFVAEDNYLITGGPNNMHWIINVKSGEIVKKIENAHSGRVYGVAFSPDAKVFASSDDKGKIKIWTFDDKAGTISNGQDLGDHYDAVLCLAFHPSKPILASGGRGGNVRLWDISKKRLIWEPPVIELQEKKHRLLCKGMNITGAKNLSSGKFEYLKSRGAIIQQN